METIEVIPDPEKEFPNLNQKLILTPQILKIIERAAGFRMSTGMIASLLGVRRETLLWYKKRSPEVREAMRRGKANVYLNVSQSLYDKAMSGDVKACIYILSMAKYYEQNPDHGKRKVQDVANLTTHAKLEKIKALQAIYEAQLDDDGSGDRSGVQPTDQSVLATGQPQLQASSSPEENLQANESSSEGS